MRTPQSPENPYIAARQEWSERYGSYVSEARNWKVVGLISLSLSVIGFGYALYQSTQIKLIPYIVEVDSLGGMANVGFPQQVEQADPRIVRASLNSFVASFRSVTPDAVVQKQYIDRVYAHLRTGDAATQRVNDWFRANSPFDRARTLTIAVEVNNIVPISGQSYQVDWTEYERDRQGKERAVRRFRGVASVTLTAPQDEPTIRLNPIGLYVLDFDWTAQI